MKRIRGRRGSRPLLISPNDVGVPVRKRPQMDGVVMGLGPGVRTFLSSYDGQMKVVEEFLGLFNGVVLPLALLAVDTD